MIKPASRNRLRAAVHAAGLPYASGLTAQLLANHFLRHQILDPAVGSTGLLSKLPIVSYQWLRPPGNRALLHVVVEQDGAALHVFAVHLLTPGILW